jgi:cell division transport system permease protein
VSLTLVGIAVLLVEQGNTLKDAWYNKVEVTVYLCTDAVKTPSCPKGATETDKQAIASTLQSLPQVKRVYYESQDQAYQEFKKSFASQPDLVRNTDPSVLPDSYRVKLVDPRKFAVVTSAVQGMTGVDSVVDAHEALKKIFDLFDRIERAMFVVAIFIAIAAIIMIVNTTRLAFFGRRREVGIMRLVGASNFYIELPFLLEGALAGVVGAVLAFGLLLLLRSLLINGLKNIPLFHTFVGSGAVVSLLPYGVAIGVVVAMVTAWGTLVRYLRT